MKKNKKILIILAIIVLGIINCSNIVYADPNRSKGFAEYSDEQASEETNKLVREQEKESPVGKSTNNYLESLEIEGYEITPNFDKQTLQYTVNGTVKSNQITIKAKADDEKAKVDGARKNKNRKWKK